MTCAYCDKPFGDEPGNRSTRDHIIPKALGGSGRHGMAPACLDCNHIKGSHTPASLRALADDMDLRAARYRNMADRIDALMTARGLSL